MVLFIVEGIQEFIFLNHRCNAGANFLVYNQDTNSANMKVYQGDRPNQPPDRLAQMKLPIRNQSHFGESGD